MFSFLSSFTPSFLIALLIWPFAAFALTLPILIAQYRRYNRLYARRAIGMYLFIFYLLGLVCFTLYPLPENAAAFCRQYHLSPQLNPLQFIADIQSDGLRAVLQIVMNFIFFIPLGVFARLLFRMRLRTVFITSFIASLLIETAQLTGVFGIYPCSYRLFDIDDLLINTIGGVAGYVLAMLIPQRELGKADKHAVVRKAGLIRHAVAFLIDDIANTTVTIFLLLIIYIIVGKDQAMMIRDIIPPVATIIIFGIVPYLARGWSLGGVMVRLNHDDEKRTALRRILFYAIRTIFVMLLIMLPGNWQWISWLVLLATLLIWRKYHKLPYQFI